MNRADKEPDDSQVEDTDQNFIYMAVYISYTKTGRDVNAAVYNSDERRFILSEFHDNEHFSNFESLILQINPQNTHAQFKLYIQLPQLNNEREKLIDIISLSEIEYEQISEDLTKGNRYKNVESDVNELLDRPLTHYWKASQHTQALQALGYLMAKHKLSEDTSNHKRFKIDTHTLAQYMKLDLAAINALSIFPKSNLAARATGDASTLYGLLDKCKTQIGSRCLKRWLKQPLQDPNEINRRLDVVECLVKDRNLLSHLQNEFLRKIPDLDKLYAKFYKVYSKKKHGSNLIDCVKVYQVVTTVKNNCEYLGGYMSDEAEPLMKYFLNDLRQCLQDFAKFEELVEQSIDMDRARKGEYVVNPAFSPKLGEIDKRTKRALESIERHRQEVSDDLGGLDIKLIESNTHTYLFEVSKKEGDNAFRSTKSKYKQISIKQRTIAFTSQKLQELVSDYNEESEKYNEEQSQVVGKILEIVSTYYPAMEKASSIIAELDCIASFAYVAMNAPNTYVRPTFNTTTKDLILKDSRHPCLEMLDSKNCVANDCEMIRSRSRLHIITGPNMGGKSTYIRQVAISVLFAHIGCFVPCSSAEVPITDAIITRVGASDMQLKGISTFMSEMLESACMLKIATENSLLIVDELGRGTSTSEGFGIAWGIAEYIVKQLGSYCLFATHFHELTVMEGSLKGVKNFYVSAISKDEQLTMLYKVKPGAVDRSYGLFVAEMLKFPAEILKNAKEKAKELEHFEENVQAFDEEMREEGGKSPMSKGSKKGDMDIEQTDDLMELSKMANQRQKLACINIIETLSKELEKVKEKQHRIDKVKQATENVKKILSNPDY